MRAGLVLLAMAGLGACDPPQQTGAPAIEAVPAAPSFDGASSTARTAMLAHGKRLSAVLGCTGCHGQDLRGELFADKPEIGTLWASNLSLAVREYDDTQLESLLRGGVRPDGSEVWAMPSDMYQHLSDGDMRALIAHLRTVLPGGASHPRPVFRDGGKAKIASGKMKPAAGYIRDEKGIAPIDLSERHSRARMITMTACAECHGVQLEGGGKTPDLDIAGAYDADQFATLMRTGKPPGGRELRMMSDVARGRFAKLSDREVAELYAYLKARADRTP